MAKLILQMQISVDGFVDSAKANNWQVWNWNEPCTWDEELKSDFNSILDSIGSVLLSRKMAQGGYIDHWGNAANLFPENSFYKFANRISHIPKNIITNKITTSPWENTNILSGQFHESVNRLKNSEIENIIAFGGASFASSLISNNLVDELQLFINPVYLGEGAKLFNPSNEHGFIRLISSASYNCGVVLNCYALRVRDK